MHVSVIVAPIQLSDGSRFDPRTGDVWRNGAIVRLEPQPAAVLAVLAARPGELVSQEELRHAVWGDATHVKQPDALHYCIRQIRLALDDSASEPRYVETVPRRGYRLRREAIVDARRAPVTPARSLRLSRLAAGVGIAAAILMTAVIVERRPNNHHQIAVGIVKTLHDMVF